MNKNASKDIGFELLLPEEYIPISRFPLKIRWLHWINAFFIIVLLILGIVQIFELSFIGHFDSQDFRTIHWITGLLWIATLVIMSFSLIFRDKFNVKQGVASDKLIIKQRYFLMFSIGFIFFMLASGLGLFFLRESEAPTVRNMLLVLHFLMAIAYVPALLIHIYLGTMKQETKRSLRTMLSDINMEYALHMPIEGLQCQVTDQDETLSLQADVIDISITRFRAKVKMGYWQEWIDLSKMSFVTFIHKDLNRPVKLPIHPPALVEHADHCVLKCKYDLPTQESARILLSRAFFFRKLFLEEDGAFRQTVDEFIRLRNHDSKSLMG